MKVSAVQNTILFIYGLILSPLIIGYVYVNCSEKPKGFIILADTEIERIPYTSKAVDSLFMAEFGFSREFEKFLDSAKVNDNDTIYIADIITEVRPDSLRRTKVVYSTESDKTITDAKPGETSEIDITKFENFDFKYNREHEQYIQRSIIKNGYIREVSYLSVSSI